MKHTRQRSAAWLLPIAACFYSAAAWALKCGSPTEKRYDLTLIESDDEDWADSAMALVSENHIYLRGYSESDSEREMIVSP